MQGSHRAPRVLWPCALCRVSTPSGHATGPGRRRPPYPARAIAAPPGLRLDLPRPRRGARWSCSRQADRRPPTTGRAAAVSLLCPPFCSPVYSLLSRSADSDLGCVWVEESTYPSPFLKFGGMTSFLVVIISL